jgi:hypothetical protein
MTVSDLWEGAALHEQQVDTRKLGKFILNLGTRLEAAEWLRGRICRAKSQSHVFVARGGISL